MCRRLPLNALSYNYQGTVLKFLVQMSTDQIRAANWAGSIPVILSLAPGSLSSPTIPSPIHVLLPRQTFLHLGLQEAVFRLQTFAPPTFSFTKRVVEEPETTTTTEPDSDEEVPRPSSDGAQASGNDDTHSGGNTDSGNQDNTTTPATEPAKPYPLCWFEDEETQLPLQWQFFAGVLWDSHRPAKKGDDGSSNTNGDMPWRIRVHFTNYPFAQLLDLDAGATGVLTTVERTFKNSLKQALVLQHGQNKVALNMTKQSHERLWDSIVSAKYATYKPIQEDIQAEDSKVVLVPIRLMMAPSKPVIQKRCDDLTLSLGDLLCLWAPKHFHAKEKAQEGDHEKVRVVESVQPGTLWRVAGVSPPLSTRLVDLWQALSHPDGFLYIAIVQS